MEENLKRAEQVIVHVGDVKALAYLLALAGPDVMDKIDPPPSPPPDKKP